MSKQSCLNQFLFPMVLLAITLVSVKAMGDGASNLSDQTLDQSRFDNLVPQLLRQHKVAGVGIGVIRRGQLVWMGYYGEQAPKVPVTHNTVFNMASVAKTVTAETMLALAAQGLIDLDEPIAPFVRHRELSKDSRYEQLTTRLLLSHRAGLLNWAYEYENNRLGFDHDPDTGFSYSGAGVQLAAQYAQEKLGRDFDSLVLEYLLRPLQVESLSLGQRQPWMRDRLAKPMDASGRYRPATRLNPGLSGNQWQASDDLLVTVEAYAQLLIGVFKPGWLPSEWVDQRLKLLSDFAGDPVWGCEVQMNIVCPDVYGHSIGWQLYRFGDQTLLKHSGNDAGENALVYFSPDTGSGAVIAVNGANGWFVSTRIVEMIGDQPHLANYYRALIEKHYKVEFPALEFR